MLSVLRAEDFRSCLSLFQLGRRVRFCTVLKLLGFMASSGCSAGTPPYACVPEMGTEFWSECHVALKQTNDNNDIVHSRSDPLEDFGSVDRGNPPGQG